MKALSENRQALSIKVAILGCVGVGAVALGSWAHAGAFVRSAAVAVPTAATVNPALPQKLVGSWSRNVTGFGSLDGPWWMRIRRGGALEVYVPGGTTPDFTSRLSVSEGGRLTIHEVPICATKGLYRWKVVGRLLTIKALRDRQCTPRIALFSGAWKRK